jgi:hypothetical protein
MYRNVSIKFSFLHCIQDALGPYSGADAGYIVCASSWFSHSPSIKTQGTWYLKSRQTASFHIFINVTIHKQMHQPTQCTHSIDGTAKTEWRKKNRPAVS